MRFYGDFISALLRECLGIATWKRNALKPAAALLKTLCHGNGFNCVACTDLVRITAGNTMANISAPRKTYVRLQGVLR